MSNLTQNNTMGMEVINLRCNNCGSNLSIKDNIKFFNCIYCRSSLTIKKTGNVAYTEVLSKIESNTENLLSNSQTMLVENEIARLDREYTIELKKYGGKTPSKYIGLSLTIGIIFFIIMLIIYFVQFTSSTHGGFDGFILLILFVYMVFFISIITYHWNRANKYFQAEKIYKEQREKLLKELKEKT